ncbi:hypothetical protein QN379_23035 [Glaciimonas sp. Gout2]|uniref:hypothetical protein n=1 Tax=unclassified Glaciimonas TaxID=2644401 RepID=UPI002AB3C72A|nr:MULTISPECIES: hypothetical protein [unclassified Glaciimonas]MDY7548906.1 hypothetical protein [Glaciimonas sp. CA11.2]MEB0014519.1 hypothetical protein [Glaciimonas sp. Cout2]MEB0084885.1 hypothetical protein [Glaciimonas sp. Gout2]
MQSEYVATNPSLSIGKGQFLFYATNVQKNLAYINSGYDKEIADVISKRPSKNLEFQRRFNLLAMVAQGIG